MRQIITQQRRPFRWAIRLFDPYQHAQRLRGSVCLQFGSTAMEIHSIAFSNGSPMPLQYTCDGKDISPPLNWTNPPAATRSFVLLCDDPDAPGGTWHHWAVYDLPDPERSLAEGASRHPKSFKQAINDFQKRGYGGPVHPTSTVYITIISDCLHFQSSNCPCTKIRPATTWNAKPVSTQSLKQI